MRLDLLVGLFCREAVRALMRHKPGSARAEAELQKLGDNLVWIEAGARNINGVRNGSHGTTSLTADDYEAIKREVPLIKRISPQVDGTIHVLSSTKNWT